ncbi:MAG: hypothetical protein J7497_12355 [Chitinophagaceae bacterium]|nr:hypothetical protein [Chitinophagaceae bacterium]
MSRILQTVAEIRSNRNTNIEILNSKIPVLEQQLFALENFQDIIESTRSDLDRYDREKENEKYISETKDQLKKKREKQWDVIKLVLAAIIGGLISFIFSIYN